MTNAVMTGARETNAAIPESWEKKDAGCTRFFVYILKLENGSFYIGQTRELKERLLEHREGLSRGTAGQHPRLRYYEIVPSRQAAVLRERQLKELLLTNRRELVRLVSEFYSLLAEVARDI